MNTYNLHLLKYTIATIATYLFITIFNFYSSKKINIKQVGISSMISSLKIYFPVSKY